MLDKNTSNWLKVFAACLVVVSHYSMYLLDYDVPFPQVILRFNSALLGKIGVAFFFLMSGYGLSESCKKHMDGFWSFLYRRVSKIYIPALVASFVLFLISKRGGCFMLLNDSPMWFVRLLILLYVVFDAFVHFNFPRWLKWVIVACLTICWFFVTDVYQASNIPFFFAGMLLSNGKRKTTIILLSSLLIACLVLVLVRKDFIYYGICYGLIILLVVFATHLRIKTIVNPTIVDMTFDLYLIHNKILVYASLSSILLYPHTYLIVLLLITVIFYSLRMQLNKIFMI